VLIETISWCEQDSYKR